MHKKLLYNIILLLLPLFCVSQTNLENELSNAVSIKHNGTQVGSGVYFLNDSTLYLITASHVLFEVDTLDQITDRLNFDKIELTSYSREDFVNNETLIEVELIPQTNLFRHGEKDVSVVKIAQLMFMESRDKFNATTLKGVTIMHQSGIISAFDPKKALNLNKVSHGNDITIIGYPSYLDYRDKSGKRVFDFTYPLIQSGIVSGVNEQLGNIVVSGPVFYGNSGGAVLYKVEKIELKGSDLLFFNEYKIIGIVSSFIPFRIKKKERPSSIDDFDFSNSGYTVVVPIDYAIEIMK